MQSRKDYLSEQKRRKNKWWQYKRIDIRNNRKYIGMEWHKILRTCAQLISSSSLFLLVHKYFGMVWPKDQENAANTFVFLSPNMVENSALKHTKMNTGSHSLWPWPVYVCVSEWCGFICDSNKFNPFLFSPLTHCPFSKCNSNGNTHKRIYISLSVCGKKNIIYGMCMFDGMRSWWNSH